MQFHADLHQRVVLDIASQPWTPSSCATPQAATFRPIAMGAGDHGAGTYLRNPAGTSHPPFSVGRCVLLVKLWQMHQDDQTPVAINTGRLPEGLA